MNAVVQPILQPDAAAMREHVEHLFGGYLDGYHDGKIELAWTDTKPDANGRYRLSHARLFGANEIDALVNEAVRLNAQPMCNVYIGAALRHPDTAPFGRTLDRDAWALTCVYVDLDDPGAANAAKDIYGPDKPTLVVVTGRAPHLRAQLWWRLDEPLTDPEHWPTLLRGIVARLGGDPTVTNPARVMRLAGSIAWPVKPGRSVEPTAIAPLKEPGPSRYDADHLARAFPPANDGGATIIRPAQFGTNSLGLTDKIVDGREAYMRNTISACLVEYIGQTGAAPTPQELYDAAWPQYERKVDLASRGGRGPDEFARKCAYTVARFNRGDIRGIETLDKAVEAYRRKRAAPARAVAVSGPPVDDAPIHVPELTGEPAPREWVADGWIPKGVITGLSGDGGMGKTLLAQQLLYAAGTGSEWLGLRIPKLRCLGVFCEDDRDELHRRHDAIKASMGHAIGNPFEGVWLWPRVGSDNLLVTFDKDNKPSFSPFFDAVKKHVLDHKIELLVLDTVADLFGGNEIIRAQVNFFVKAVCGAFIREAKAAGFTLTVLLLSHPSQAGRNSGTGESGSTAWNNAVRARLYLTRPEDGIAEQRVLTRKKSNYSASGDDVKLDLLWVDGVLKTVTSTRDNRVAVASLENQIRAMVNAAWEADEPYKAKPSHPKYLDRCMMEAFGGRFEAATVVAAMNSLRTQEIIFQDRLHHRRGWCAASIKNRSQDIENAEE